MYIGLDAGTSEIKAALFDERFVELATTRARVPVSRPEPGYSEVDPEDVLAAAFDVLERIAREAERHDGALAALGLTGAMVGAWTVDARGEATGPGILWEDCRAESMLAERRRHDPALERRIFERSGCALQQGCTLPLLAWLIANEPARMARTAHVVGLKDFIRFRLTGEIATDVSEAAVAPGSAAARGRSAALIELFGLTSEAHRLPPPKPSEALAGRVTPEAARRGALPVGLPVAVGAGDVPSSVVGAGGAGGDALTVILGTTCLVGRELGQPRFEPFGLGLLFTLPDERWFRAMVNVAGTLNLDWALGTLAPECGGDVRAFERLATRSEPGAGGVTWLPYLSESGIIAPIVDPAARAEFAGLTPRTTRADLARAVYEGVAFAIADCVDLLDPAPDATVRLVGGGARSDFWTTMIADVLGRAIERPAGEQLGARGAAVMAAVAAGRYPDVGSALAHGRADTTATMPSSTRYASAIRMRWTRHRERAIGCIEGATLGTPAREPPSAPSREIT